MRKSQLNFLIDSIAFAAFVFLATTGILMKYLLPPGSGHFSTIWGLDRHQWGDIHFWISITFFAVLALHLFLHWKWIVCMVKGKVTQESGKRFALGILGVFGIIAISISPLVSPVEKATNLPSRINRNMRTAQEFHDVEESSKDIAKQGSQQTIKEKPPKTYSNSDYQDIRGYMTLGEIEEKCGIPYKKLLDELNITESVDTNEQAGRLMRKYGYTMQDLRIVIDEYQVE